ncbi:MAG TPA: hypothetical protein VNE16_04275 [Vicinamibacterales bacterium]|nr:hypothetical protein [Vicinamibacterales bacterium]
MKTEERVGLGRFLDDFAAGHPGVRAGRLFGRPALFAGRRTFACVTDAGLLRCRLPADEARRLWASSGRTPALLGTPAGEWVIYHPGGAAALARLVPILEMAAKATAERRRPGSSPRRT